MMDNPHCGRRRALRSRASALALALLGLMLSGACQEGSDPIVSVDGGVVWLPAPGELQYQQLLISPQSVELVLGDPATLITRLLATNGTTVDPVVAGLTIDWSSSVPQVVSVDEFGGIEALSPGVAVVSGEFRGIVGEVEVTVLARPSMILLTDLPADGNIQGTASSSGAVALQVRDENDDPVAGATVRFEVLTGGGSVAPAELIAGGDGAANAIWTFGQVAGQQALQITAVRGGSAPAGEPPAVLSVIGGIGGPAAVGEPDEVLASTVVYADVGAAAPAAVVVSPSVATVPVGDRQVFTARVIDEFGNETESQDVSFTSSNTIVLGVDASGDAVGLAAGAASVIATSTFDTNVEGFASVSVLGQLPSPVTVTTPSLPNGGIGVGYQGEIAATGGDGTYSWAIIAGTLPTGLLLEPGTGAITGTPTTAGTQTFTVEVTSDDATATMQFSITVVYPVPMITTASPLPSGVNAIAYMATVAATGGDGNYTWSLTGQPGWLSIDPITGELSGAAETGSYSFAVNLSSGDGQNTSQNINLTVFARFPLLSVTTQSPLPNGVDGAGFSETVAGNGGDGNYTWSLADPPGWLSIDPITGELSGTALTGSYNFAVDVSSGDGQNTSKFFSLDVYDKLDVTTASPLPKDLAGSAYSETVVAMGGDGDYVWSLTGEPGWLSIDPNTGELDGTAATGAYSFDVDVSSGDGQNASQNFDLTIYGVLSVTTASSLPTGVDGMGYGETVAATGGDGSYMWSLTGAPAWLGIDSNTGELSGTAVLGNYTFDVAVSSGDGQNASETFDLMIVATPDPLGITTASPLPNVVSGVGYAETVLSTGGLAPYVWSLSGGAGGIVPAWLSIDPGSGQFSGTAATGVYTFDVDVSSNDGQNVSKTFGLAVFDALSVATASPLPDDLDGNSYDATVQATGGDGNYMWSLSNGVGGLVPGWLSIDPNTGQFSGTAVLGSYTFDVAVSSGDGQNASKTFDLMIVSVAAPLGITSGSPLPNGVSGLGYTETVLSTGGLAPHVWSLSDGAGGMVPAWLSIDPGTGQFSGTAATGVYTFDVDVSSSDGQNASMTFGLTVFDALSVATASPLTFGVDGAAYDVTVAATGGDGNYAWSLSDGAGGMVPGWLSIDPNTGQFSGTGAIGIYTFDVDVSSNDGQNASKTFVLAVANALAVATASLLMSGIDGAAYGVTVAATGGGGDLTWSLSGGAGGMVPGWLSIDPGTGQLSGTAAAGNYTFDVDVSSQDGQNASRTFDLTVVFPTLSITTASPLTSGIDGAAYGATVAATGGDGIMRGLCPTGQEAWFPGGSRSTRAPASSAVPRPPATTPSTSTSPATTGRTRPRPSTSRSTRRRRLLLRLLAASLCSNQRSTR